MVTEYLTSDEAVYYISVLNVRLAVVPAPVYLMKTRNNLGEESSLGWVEGDEGEAELIVLAYDRF